MPALRLLLISRDDILRAMDGENDDRIFRLLASLGRLGFHLLATAPQPDKWTGEHGSPDDALLGPNSIRKRLADAGGILDGVYYVRRSMLTQKRNRVDALQDILKRYAAKPEHTVLLSSSRKFVKLAQQLGLQASLLDDQEHSLLTELASLSERSSAEA
jgi:hypothetical protein